MESGATHTFRAMVVAKQLEGQWAILEGHPKRAKSSWGVKMVNPTMANSIKKKVAVNSKEKEGGGGKKEKKKEKTKGRKGRKKEEKE